MLVVLVFVEELRMLFSIDCFFACFSVSLHKSIKKGAKERQSNNENWIGG